VTTSATRLLALLGHPVAHSASPQIHTGAIHELGLDLAYVACDVAPEALPAAVAGLGALGALGANVTVPHKRAALDLADEVTGEATAVGAVNTLVWRDGRLIGDNTDARGLEQVLVTDAGLRAGDGVVLVGAGGAALAAAVALGRLGARVEVAARRAEAAREVERRLVTSGAEVGPVPEPRLVLNATPLGLHGETLPERFLALGRGQVALDLVYGSQPTPFLKAAAGAGALALDGLGLLVAQAALSFTCWTGRPAPIAAMRRAAEAAMGRMGEAS
jgi:shikimate dehydrogenase